jgi:4a-hydroxytetrahydrobiopterin dehydratase
MNKLDSEQVAQHLARLPGWELRGGREIARLFNFKNYHETMAFVNATAWISHQRDHHPDLEVSYNKCTVHYSTHSVGGLSDEDFACAESVSRLIASDGA